MTATRLTTIRERVGVESTEALPAYSWPGGYDILYITDDGACLCAKCANANGSEDPDDKHSGWYIEGVDSAANSASCHYCDNCNAQLGGYCSEEDGHSEFCDNREVSL